MLRVGLVSYLNALPLAGDLAADPRLDIRPMPPSAVARALVRGEVDIGLVPSFTLLARNDLTWLPGLAIASTGPVDSVFLHLSTDFESRRPDRRFRLALDPHSRTSQVLARLVLEQRFGVREVEAVEMEPRAALATQDFDAVLVIGDLALRLGEIPGRIKVDLASAWSGLTGLPFVFAVWGLGADLARSEPWLGGRFLAALDNGLGRVDELASGAAAAHGISADRARDYLRRCIQYRLGPLEERGLRLFLAEASRLLEREGKTCSI